MIALRAIPPSIPIELNQLGNYEAGVIIILAVAIAIIFFKRKYFTRKQQLNSNAESSLDYLERDVLMQPKQYQDTTQAPFTNFSMDFWHIAFYLALFVIFCYLLA